MLEAFQKIGSALNGYLAAAAALLSVAGVYLYARFATRRQVDEVEKRFLAAERSLEGRIVELEKAVTKLNLGLRNTPTRAEWHEIKTGMEELRGDLKGMSARMDGLNSVLARIETPLNLLIEHHMSGR